MKSLFYALLSALVTAAFIAGSPAFAQPSAGEARTQVRFVPTADLDLRSPEGERRLHQRLARAARAVCGTASDADLKGKRGVRECRSEAIARALDQRDEVLAAAGRGAAIAVVAVNASR